MGLTSNFVASFYGYSHAETKMGDAKMTKLKNIVSTALNELVENSAKYSKESTKQFISIIFKLYEKYLTLEVKNFSNASQYNDFSKALDTLIKAEDYEALYFKQLEQKAEAANHNNQSSLGLLMLLKDYKVDLSAKFQKYEDDKYEICILCKIDKSISE